MNLQDESNLKVLAKGLRRELKQTTGAELSHNQVLELIAKSLGHSSLASFQAGPRRGVGDAEFVPAFSPTELQVKEVADRLDIAMSMVPGSDPTGSRNCPTFSQIYRFAEVIAGMADERAQALLASKSATGDADETATALIDMDADSLQLMAEAADRVVSANRGYRNGLVPDMLLAALAVPCKATRDLCISKPVPAVFKPYRLFNTKGELDVVEIGQEDAERVLVAGLGWRELAGTYESVLATAYATCEGRDGEGGLELNYDGGSAVHWDTQEQRINTRGKGMWTDGHGFDFAEDECVLVPQRANGYLEEAELSVRERLVDSVFRYIRDRGDVAKALTEMQMDDFECFEFQKGFSNHPVMEQAQRAAGFSLHHGEMKRLMDLLAAA